MIVLKDIEIFEIQQVNFRIGNINQLKHNNSTSGNLTKTNLKSLFLSRREVDDWAWKVTRVSKVTQFF